MQDAELLRRLGELIAAHAETQARIDDLVRENANLRDLNKAGADRQLTLAAPMERAARAAEEIASREFTLLLKMATDIEALKTGSAVMVDNVKEVRHDLTGKIPLATIDDNDTDKTIGKVVRRALPIAGKIFPWVTAAGLGLWHLIEKLAHLAK